MEFESLTAHHTILACDPGRSGGRPPGHPGAVHSLRHTVGAYLRKRGADIRDIQDVLRHADIGTTQIYTHMAREELRKKLPRRFANRDRPS